MPNVVEKEPGRNEHCPFVGSATVKRVSDSSNTENSNTAQAATNDQDVDEDVVQRDPAPSQPLPECDICFFASIPKKPSKEASEEDVTALSSVEVVFEGSKICPFQLAKNIRTEEAVIHGGQGSEATVHSCADCMKDFRKMLRLKEAQAKPGINKKEKERKERDFRKYMERYCNRRRRNQPGASKSTVASRQCFLKHRGNKPCSEGNAKMQAPGRLKETNETARKLWSERFSVKAGITKEVAREIIDRCLEICLCSLHGSMSRNTLDRIEAENRKCSLCGNLGGRVTPFNWEKLKENEETHCVVEDAIAANFDNAVSPYDINLVCDGCRRLVLRQIDVRANAPKEKEDRYERRGRYRRTRRCVTNQFIHGPTRVAIRRLINWIREEIRERDRNVVLMRDIRRKYDELVVETGEEPYALKHDRSIRKFIQPSLAVTGIHAEVGAKKVGTYFFCRSALHRLAAEAKTPPKEAEISTAEEADLLEKFKDFILSRQEEITQSRWSLADYIRAVPHKLWFRRLQVPKPTHILRRCKSRARLQDKSYFEEWPCNPQDCPDDIQRLPAYEFGFVVSLYFSFEQEVFNSCKRARGPIMAALSLTALTSTNISYLSLLNRLSCAASYQLIDGMGKAAISARQLAGPFESLVPGRFVVGGIDNINKRSSHSIAVHDGTYHGFDGLALQAVNSNVSFDFSAYCQEHPDGKEPKRFEADRMKFMKNFPTPDDPDLTAYRWLSIGAALTNKDCIASDDRSKQKSYRKVVMDHLQGFTWGKAKVEFVKVEHCDPNSAYEINRLIKTTEAKFNPPGCKEFTMVAIAGDQPIFKHLFQIWIDSYVKKTRLCRWMVPIPGGFHIDKQGLIPMIKAYLSGAGMEDLLKFSGLSKRHQEMFIGLAHYRKSRRFLSQMTAAYILRLAEALVELDPTFAESLESMLEEVRMEEALSSKEREELSKKPSRVAELKQIFPDGASLALDQSVSPTVLRIGKMICEKINKIAKDSVNMRFFGESQLLNLLIPWTGHNLACPSLPGRGKRS